MTAHDDTNESDEDDGVLGEEKFFVVQQKLSNGSVAVFIADDHTYDIGYLPDVLLKLLNGDTFADEAQKRIRGILLDYGNALKTEVCEEDSVQERQETLEENGLTRGTLALITPGNTWVTYMGDTLSDGYFDGYQVSRIERDSGGFVKTIQLSKYGRSGSTITEEGAGVSTLQLLFDRYDITLLASEGRRSS